MRDGELNSNNNNTNNTNNANNTNISNSNRLEDVQRNNDFRNDADNYARNATLPSSSLNSGGSPSKNSSISNQTPTESMISGFKDGIKNIGKGSNQDEKEAKLPKNQSSFPTLPKKNNDGLTTKQRVAKKGLQMAGTAINPALGAAMKSKMGERLTNALLQKKGLVPSPFAISPIVSTAANTKKDEEEKDEKPQNRFGSVSVVISKKAKVIVIPVACACAVLLCGCLIVIASAHSYISVLGIDLSSQISLDDILANKDIDNTNVNIDDLGDIDGKETVLNSLTIGTKKSNKKTSGSKIIDLATEVIEHYEGVGCMGQPSIEGKNYIACVGTDNVTTIGRGVVWEHNMEFFKKYGIDSLSVGQKLPIETVDQIKDDIIQSHYDKLIQSLNNAGIDNLKDYQLSALIVRSYNCGPGSITDSFIPVYLKYNGKYKLKDMYSSNPSLWTESMNGPNYALYPGDSPGLYSRRVGEWTLFVTGKVDYMENNFDASKYAW